MGTQEITHSSTKILEDTPSQYKVILLNDDYTSMDFVVQILMDIFGHKVQDAINIMLAIHENGRGICGVYSYEIAETKIAQVRTEAKKQNFPLRIIMEEE